MDLALNLGASYAEARYIADSSQGVSLRNGNVEAVWAESNGGYAVRVLVSGAWGFAAVRNPRELEEAVGRAVKLARASSRLRRRPVTLSEERAYRLRYEHPAKKPPTQDDLLGLAKKLDEAVAIDARVRTRIIHVAYSERRRVFVNSEGAEVESRTPLTTAFLSVSLYDAEKGSAYKFVEFGGAGGLELEEERGWSDEASDMVRKMLLVLERGVAPEKGKQTIVFGPELAGIFVHESVGHPLELDRIMGREAAEAGESYASPGDFGRRVIGSPHVTIIDDPTIPGSLGFALVDEEGVLARPRTLVRRGVVWEPLSNREYAAYIGSRSTAAARSSEWDREPIPRMSNTYLAPGDWKPDEVLAETRRGIYIEYYSEWNIDDRRWRGRYGAAVAWLVERGEPVRPLRGVFIEVETPELWGSVDAVANDLKFYGGVCGKGNPMQGVPVWMGGPTFRASARVVD